MGLFDFIGDIFEGVGDVVESVVDFAGNFIQNILDNPLKALVKLGISYITGQAFAFAADAAAAAEAASEASGVLDGLEAAAGAADTADLATQVLTGGGEGASLVEQVAQVPTTPADAAIEAAKSASRFGDVLPSTSSVSDVFSDILQAPQINPPPAGLLGSSAPAPGLLGSGAPSTGLLYSQAPDMTSIYDDVLTPPEIPATPPKSAFDRTMDFIKNNKELVSAGAQVIGGGLRAMADRSTLLELQNRRKRDAMELAEWQRRFMQQAPLFTASIPMRPATGPLLRPSGQPVYGPNGLLFS